jgi:hypothetical protein
MGTLAGFILGYILGAQAGPERLEELRKAWQTIVNSEEFKGLVGAGTAFAGDLMGKAQSVVGGNLLAAAMDNPELRQAWVKVSGNSDLLAAFDSISKSPEVQSLLVNGASLVRGVFERGAATLNQ